MANKSYFIRGKWAANHKPPVPRMPEKPIEESQPSINFESLFPILVTARGDFCRQLIYFAPSGSKWRGNIQGAKGFSCHASFSLHPNNWIREDVIFFSQHGPFPAYLKRFHLSDSDYCSSGGIGTALYYATECIYTVSWHMRKPAPNFEQEWLKRVANNLVSRHKIRGIIKFISENKDLFRPP
ncbi:hypothetical protein AVEN_5468-1 [Araneus ventricosus]|uniref:Uncharacterized protein n=1 Tax=Araneus ventricosus TaxID=182803 RepID=A0A4Y2DYR7_ARAVE|nr:hypothetical protein AVEN_141371-1 [Araneus ventricosus]GBM21156.1 hypothetical protein AVEN_5468-1 [Araneus ventricosus]